MPLENKLVTNIGDKPIQNSEVWRGGLRPNLYGRSWIHKQAPQPYHFPGASNDRYALVHVASGHPASEEGKIGITLSCVVESGRGFSEVHLFVPKENFGLLENAMLEASEAKT